LDVSPADGAELSASPSEIRISLDHPIEPWSIGPTDILVERIGLNGEPTVVVGDGSFPWIPALDASGTTVTLATPGVFAPGRYRISISPLASWQGADGSYLAPLEPMVLSEFTIRARGTGLGDATELGRIDSAVTSVWGRLELETSPSHVALYRIELGAGHYWRLGLEVSTSRIGSGLAPALALFDESGVLLDATGFGPPAHPNDPYLFRGLAPGIYYVGVSGYQNVPGEPGGYDLVRGTAGMYPSYSPSGRFRLDLVADEVDTAPSVEWFRTDYGDALDPDPTGFTIQFSRAMRVSSGFQRVSETMAEGLEVVDSSGAVWEIAAVGYDERSSTMRFLFEDRLPAGEYTVRVSAGAMGLTDLAGLRPVAAGLPADVLARFEVMPGAARGLIPGVFDLGAPRPREILGGVGYSRELAPGETAEVRGVVLYTDAYLIDLAISGAPLHLVAVNVGSGEVLFEGDVDSFVGRVLMRMGEGEYRVRLTNLGDENAEFSMNMWIPMFSWEIVIGAGLGQGPALGLRLIGSDSGSALAGVGGLWVSPPIDPNGMGPWISSPVAIGGTETSLAVSPGGSVRGVDDSVGGGSVISPGVFSTMAPIMAAVGGEPLGRPGNSAGGISAHSSVVAMGESPWASLISPSASAGQSKGWDVAPTAFGSLAPTVPGREEAEPEAVATEVAATGKEPTIFELGFELVDRALAMLPSLGWSRREANVAEIAALVADPSAVPPADPGVAGGEEVQVAGFGTPLDVALILIGMVEARRAWNRRRSRLGGGWRRIAGRSRE
jgi:hypothetical protein